MCRENIYILNTSAIKRIICSFALLIVADDAMIFGLILFAVQSSSIIVSYKPTIEPNGPKSNATHPE
jgi:hypothetical protein